MTDVEQYRIVGPVGEEEWTPSPYTDPLFPVGFKLSGKPDGTWKSAFHRALDGTLAEVHRPSHLFDDKIIVYVVENDDLGAVLDALKRAVDTANKRLARVTEQQEQEAARRDAAQAERLDAEKRLREQLSDLEY